MIRHSIDAHTQPIPAVLEIPSKDHPYDATKDSILRRAKVIRYFSFKLITLFSNSHLLTILVYKDYCNINIIKFYIITRHRLY